MQLVIKYICKYLLIHVLLTAMLPKPKTSGDNIIYFIISAIAFVYITTSYNLEKKRNEKETREDTKPS